MTDAHCHVASGDPSVREFLIGRDFFGIHPWEAAELSPEDLRRKTEDIRARLASPVSGSSAVFPGVGEIGLDRLKAKAIPPAMRETFETQLRLAFELGRPVVLHGAKCWGQVVREIEQSNNRTIPSLLFHGFSRSDGLIPDIVRLNGYISVGPAVLNDHAVNYRELVKKIPLDRLLVETDRTAENAATCPSIEAVLAKAAELRGLSAGELERITDANAEAFRFSLSANCRSGASAQS